MTSPAQTPQLANSAALVEKLLACPRTHLPLTVSGQDISCPGSSFTGTIRDEVAIMMPSAQASYFDDKFEVMRSGHESEGEWSFCYAQQTELLSSYLRAGQVVLDVGCGPSLPYQKPPGALIVGLEPSFHSIRVNHEVDLRVYGSATEIPMADHSVDIVACFYSIHHMVGATKRENEAIVARAFAEFGRVLKPGGMLFVFEMTPVTLFSLLQAVCWNSVRRLVPSKLDMYFWSAKALAETGRRHLPAGSILEKVFFGASAFTTFPPAFSLPWIKVPRLVYPLDAKLYKWRMAGP
jgi:ubiquinone/menaquinone biosynthesis C-methylase UbiE